MNRGAENTEFSASLFLLTDVFKKGIIKNKSEVRILRNETFYYLDSRKADKNAVITLAGISYPDPTYSMERKRSDVYVFEYVIEGKGVVCVENDSCEVCAGDVYILKKGEKHKYFSDKNEPMKKIWFNADGRIISHLLSDYSLNEVTRIKGFNDISIFLEIRETLLACKAEKRLHGSEIDIIIHRLIEALSSFVKKQESPKSEAQILAEYIDSRAEGKVSLAELSAKIYRSQTHTINVFKEAYGKTPYDYMLERKIENAKLLLKNTAMSVGSICAETGFSESQYFSRYFKRKTGMTPVEYRKRMREESK